ncbi:MAG: bifunctional (p)ppGpp synthetase/guanosine-3',5'-bis(diphosphate) 3'-pyrophosphohydrolase [Clostridia bacterium]|nr:bifunctional (p)ppGpp synthetase/guanosine-3',5'-bis(diphosphate) 3'-pyrophosphohydrolase [Clostridia bacterium]
MIYTELTKKALRLCFEAHKNQVDKSGLPYVFHPFHVAEQMTTEETTAVALLHDVIEDTDYTLADIAAMGFPQSVTDALKLLTHDERVPYMTNVAAIKQNPIARAVKLADLRHNSDLSRLDHIDAAALERVQKYRSAIRLLTSNTDDLC